MFSYILQIQFLTALQINCIYNLIYVCTYLFTLKQRNTDCMQHYPCCANSSNGNKLIFREKLCLICLKPVTFSNCLVEYLTFLTSTCIILKIGTCWCTAQIAEEVVYDLPFCVSCDADVVCVMLTVVNIWWTAVASGNTWKLESTMYAQTVTESNVFKKDSFIMAFFNSLRAWLQFLLVFSEVFKYVKVVICEVPQKIQ